jgi:toxin YoeB
VGAFSGFKNQREKALICVRLEPSLLIAKSCEVVVGSLLKDIDRNSYDGIGKPEPLKYECDNQGCWSRRIDETNRLVYYIEDDKIIILQCRTHYKDK